MPDQLQIDFPPATHAGDPPSSHYAEDRVTRSGQRQRQAEDVLAAIQRHALVAMTAAELAEASGLDRYTVSRRLPELERAGHVHSSRPQTRPCRVLGSRCVEWWAA